MCDFQPGDVVVCVDAERRPNLPDPGLTKGAIYTITEWIETQQGSAVLLAEKSSDLIWIDGRAYRGWGAKRFRRVYRPDGTFIAQCLAPIRDKVSA